VRRYDPREIPRPAGKSAGLRDDGIRKDDALPDERIKFGPEVLPHEVDKDLTGICKALIWLLAILTEDMAGQVEA